ncbi:MAG: flagellar assembly protein FliW [bacterium]
MRVEFETTRFGKVSLAADAVIDFPKGLIGFEPLKRFVLLDSRPGSPIQWLQALDDPGVAFLVSDPKVFLPDFELKIGDPGSPEEPPPVCRRESLRTLTLLHVDHAAAVLHVHVQAPLLVDPLARRGVQVIADTPHPTVAVPLARKK